MLSQQIYTFTYTDENQLASVKDSASAQLTNFEYTSSGSIKSALSFVQKNEEQTRPVTGTFFTYKYRHTVVATAQNSANDSPATTRIGYFFDTNGELQHTAEWAVDQYKGLSHVNKTPFTTNIEQVQNATIHSFIFSDNGKGADTIDVQDFKLFLNPIQTPPHSLVLPTNQKYVFCGKACIENLDPQLETLTATLIAGNGNKLCTLEFDPNQKEFQFQSKSFDAYSGEAEYYVKLNVGKTQAHATVGDFKILLSSAPTVCIDQTVSGKKSHVERSSNGSKTWYEMKECTLNCDDEDYVENVAFTFKDYMLTKLSMLKNPESYNVWFNDGRGMFINIEHTFLSFYLQPSFQLANAKFALLQSASNKTTFTHIEPPEDQGTYLTNFFKIKTVVNGVTTEQQTTVPFAESEEEYDQFFRVKKSIDVNGIETTYYYDNIGNVTSVYTNPVGSNGVNVVRSFEYNSQGNLSTETDYRTWETYNTTYTYNDENLLASVKTPIDQTTNYTYTADNEKLQSISSTLAYPYYTATNNIVYSGDYVDSLTANDTTFRFTYDERNDVKSVSIRSTEDESVFNFESQSNFNDPWNASRTVTYGNGQKIRRYYDVYNRLIRVNDVTSTYKPLALYIYSAEELSKVESDEIKISNPNDYRLVRSSDAKLRRVIMPTSQSLATVIDYTYDYSGQVTKTNRYNQAITTSDTNVAFNQSQQATSSLTVEQTQKDEYQRTTKTTATCNDITLVNSCTYESFVTDAVTQENTEVKSGNSTLGTVQTDYTTDGLKRLQSVKVTVNGNGYSRDIAYIPRQTRTLIPGPGGGFEPVIKAKAAPIYKTETVGTTYYPSLVTTKELRNNSAVETESLSLTYDANGNITTYGYNTYTYDKFNRLTRENNYYLDKTIIWAYDVGGNITSRKEYALTTSSTLFNPTKTDTYSYSNDWKDQLTSYNGYECVYDSAGNPTNYRWNTLTWEGRLLKSFKTVLGSQPSTMTYTADGMRASKVAPSGNGTKSHYYTYNGSTLVQEKIVTSSGQTDYLTFLYNGEGLTGFVLNNTLYTYRKNLFGDIIAIYQGNTKVAEYAYDAYGNCTIVFATGNAGILNPFRYRGYYYDSDIELYYLQSRYYDPELGRFINADDVSYLDPKTIHGLNLYAYCLNNPVMYSDPSGKLAATTFIIAILALTTVGGIVIGGIKAYNNAVDSGKTGRDLVKSILGGMLLGAALGVAAGGLIIAATGAAVAAFAAISGASMATIFGMAAIKVAYIGIAIYNIVAATLGPLLGLYMPLIEGGTPGYTPTKPQQTPKHPSN